MSVPLSGTQKIGLVSVFSLLSMGGCKPKGQEENGRIVAPRLQSVSVHRVVVEQGCKGDDCRSRIELAVEEGRWFVDRRFPADQAKVAGLIRTWRRLVSDKVLVGTDAKRRGRLGLSKPCMKVSWWSESRRELELRVACPRQGGPLVVWDGNGPVHLVSKTVEELGGRPHAWFLSHRVMVTPKSDLSGIRIQPQKGKPLVLIRKVGWKLVLSGWTMPADASVVGALIESLGALKWKAMETRGPRPAGPSRIELFTGSGPWVGTKGHEARPSEVISLGRCAGGGLSVTRTTPYPATGCVEGTSFALPSSLDLLDKSLLVLQPSEVMSVRIRAGALSLLRSRTGWKIKSAGRELEGDAEAVSEYLKRLSDAKADGIELLREKNVKKERCLSFDTGGKLHSVCIVGTKGEFSLVRRDQEPVVFEFPAGIRSLFQPVAMQFFSRVAVTLPMGLVSGVRMIRAAKGRRYVETAYLHGNGEWFLREPLDAQADPMAASELSRRLARLVVRRYRPIRSFTGGVAIELIEPEHDDRGVDGLMPFFKAVLKTALPDLAAFRLEVARTRRGCVGRLWGLGFDLDRNTCLALTRSLVPRRLLPGLRPDFAREMTLCVKGHCRVFQVGKGRCAAKDGGPISQEACRVRVADAVGLMAERILGFEPSPRSASAKICLRFDTAASGGAVSQGRLSRTCLLFGPQRDGVRALWVEGRPVVYGVVPALADRLLRAIPKR